MKAFTLKIPREGEPSIESGVAPSGIRAATIRQLRRLHDDFDNELINDLPPSSEQLAESVALQRLRNFGNVVIEGGSIEDPQVVLHLFATNVKPVWVEAKGGTIIANHHIIDEASRISTHELVLVLPFGSEFDVQFVMSKKVRVHHRFHVTDYGEVKEGRYFGNPLAGAFARAGIRVE